MEKKETLYSSVYNDILSKIKNGELKVGDKLPTEMKLTQIYGVSRITISRALKELANINLICRVKKSGTFVNGKVNRMSAPLIISTIMPFDENFNAIIKGIQDTGLANNVFTPFYNSKNNIYKEQDFLNSLIQDEPNGLIIYPNPSTFNLELYAKILSLNVPIVCIDRNIYGFDTPLVTTTNEKSMQDVVNTLVKLGHRKIGFCAINEQMAITESERFNGFCQGIIRNQLPLKNEYIFNMTDLHKREINLSCNQQRKLLQKYVDKVLDSYQQCDDKPTAVCCTNDSLMETVRTTAIRRGIRVPEDLMLTGFDCNDPEQIKQEGAISIKQNFYTIGSTAMELILKMINNQSYRKLELVDGALIGYPL